MRYWSKSATVVGAALVSQPAQACIVSVPINISDVKFADVVVVGRIANYHITRDDIFRRKRLASSTLSSSMRRMYSDPKQILMSDYARFDVLVDEVLTGRAAKRITVTWDNSTFGEPRTMASGPFLIALRRAGSRTPPLRGPSATVLPDTKASLLTVLQAPCAGAFIFASESSYARTLRQALIAGSR